ncbi:MAG TPA: 4'-phosphopantetheinyl transferase superfamily protein [Terriglobales bacterium]|nr:4'-phosphopantetheinyl transferase superfamily protein [Terriglobales bacterium]
MSIAEKSWAAPSFPVALSNGELQLWRFDLRTQSTSEEKQISTLSAEERRRAACYLSKNARKQFINGRWALRTILGYYLNTEPNLIEFHYGRYGKPYIEHGYGEDAVQFSLTHSHDIILYAFTRGHRVGIDVELVQDFSDIEQMLEKDFTEQQTMSRNEKIKVFFDHWTRQEAQLKAVGTGFAQWSRGFVDRTHHITDCERSETASQWFEFSFKPSLGFTSTVVVEGTTIDLRFLSFDCKQL